jgi:hypothetical protein
VPVGSGVGVDGIGAELLEAGSAGLARAVGIDEAADADEITGLVPADGRADSGNPTDDLVPRNDRVGRRDRFAPLVPHRVHVGVADAAEKDLDLNVAFGEVASLDRGRCEG